MANVNPLGLSERQELQGPWALAIMLFVAEHRSLSEQAMAGGGILSEDVLGEKHFCLVRAKDRRDAYESAVVYAQQIESWYGEFAADTEFVNKVRGELGPFVPARFLGFQELVWISGPIEDGMTLHSAKMPRVKADALLEECPVFYDVQTKKWLAEPHWCLGEVVLTRNETERTDEDSSAVMCLVIVEATGPTEAIEKVTRCSEKIRMFKGAEWRVAGIREVSPVEGTFLDPIVELLYYRVRLPLEKWHGLVKSDTDLRLFFSDVRSSRSRRRGEIP